MSPETRLDYAVFQLTPTRTRCDLFIVVNGKKEKIASGLLDPFLSHLKTARDQMEKGGYSITLEPGRGDKGTFEWFTKGTMERFVRFVSTPEVLERVNTIESEIIQIEEALAIQGNESIGLSTHAEDRLTRSSESNEGSRSFFDADAEKAIVPYKPGAHSLESNGSIVHEENSKVQFLRVLETRKSVLQKEQGMAFARATAAGFGMDNVAHLVSFSQSFGALRLREACTRFMDLWKRKHETDQWLEGIEIEGAEAMSSRSDFSSMNAPGIILSGETRKLKEFREAWSEVHGDLDAESNGKTNNEANTDSNSDHLTSGHSRPPQVPLGPHEYYQGQFQQPMFPPWPLFPPQGAPVFHAYPMQGMPYYPNYTVSGAFFQPPYPPMEDPRSNAAQRIGRRHSMESKDSNFDPEAYEMDASVTRSQDSADQAMQLESDGEALVGRESRRKSGKTRSGKVLIQNINYVTSKRQNTTGSNSRSDPSSETEEGDNLRPEERKQTSSVRSSRKKESNDKSTDAWNSYDKGNEVYAREADSGNWQAFQNCLLRDDEESTSGVDRGLKEVYVKRRHVTSGGGSTLLSERDFGGNADQKISEFYIADSNSSRIYKHKASNDELVISHGKLLSSDGRELRDDQRNLQFDATEGGLGGYRRMPNDQFMIYGRQNESATTASMSINEIGFSDNVDRSLANNLTDESFIVPFRSSSRDRVGTDNRCAIDIDSELPSFPQRTKDSGGKIELHGRYEPEDLSMMLERGAERVSIGYDPTKDHELQLCAEMPAYAKDVRSVGNENRVLIGTADKGLRKSDKEKKLSTQVPLEKRKMDVTKKGKSSKLSPLAEAQVRAERLRAFKADLQKVKKEKEEDEKKRLETLKRERQKRIATRGSQSPIQSPLPSQQTRFQLPAKFSPSSQKSSKFNDTETRSSSPIIKLAIKTAPVGFSDSQKNSKSSRLNTARSSVNGRSRSVSSLPELRKKNNSFMPESKPTSIRTRRLSEPKNRNSPHVSIRLLEKISPSSQKSSKFNDTETRSSPIIKLAIKAAYVGSSDSQKTSKSSRLNGARLSVNGRSRSVSSLRELKKENNSLVPESKPASFRTRRLSEPKSRNSLHASPLKAETSPKSKASSEPEIKKISKITSLDKAKSGAAHKLRIKTSTSDVVQNKLDVKETMLKGNRSKFLTMETIKTRNNVSEILSQCNAKENVVIEKSVVTAEKEIPPAIDPQFSKESMDSRKQPDDDEVGEGEKVELVSECVVIQAPASPITLNYARDALLLKEPSINADEKSYHAPYARNSSLEDPCTRNSEYTRTLPASSESVETVRAHVPDLTKLRLSKQIPDSLKKLPHIESSKGFRRLLKFGRKNHISGADGNNVELEQAKFESLATAGHIANSNSATEVHTLQNLLSQDDSHSGASVQKVSRPFSLLSQFRSKVSEKVTR